MLSGVIAVARYGTILYVCRIMLNRLWLKLIVILAAVLPLCTTAQTKEFARQRQVWYGFYPNIKFGEKWSWNNEIENRQFIVPSAENLFFIRTHLHYQVHKHWDVAAGFAYFLVNTQNPDIDSKLFIPEYRPFEEANNSVTFKDRYTITNRLRFEQRWIQKTSGTELVEGFNFNMRFRYRFGVDILLWETKAKKHGIKLRLSDEVMVNIPTKVVKNVFDQWRGYTGIYYQPPGPMAFEVGHLYWLQQRATEYQYFSRNVIRFSVYLKVNWPVKKAATSKG